MPTKAELKEMGFKYIKSDIMFWMNFPVVFYEKQWFFVYWGQLYPTSKEDIQTIFRLFSPSPNN